MRDALAGVGGSKSRVSGHDDGTDPPGPTHRDSARQMDGAWRVWESLTNWDARYARWVDIAVAVGLFLFCSGWFFQAGPIHTNIGFDAALTAPLFLRRRVPFCVFLFISAVAVVQLVTSTPALADAALLVALYSVSAVSQWVRVVVSLLILQVGVIAATVHWDPVGSHFESLVFLTGMNFAAFLTGAVVRALRGQIDWLAERAQRLERERDQQASLAAATERARIARELHDVVSHNLQVMVTLADAACVTRGQESDRATEAMREVANTGRQAMTDMRRMLGLWRDETRASDPLHTARGPVDPPQPRLDELEALVERVRATGLGVSITWEGTPFELSEAAELTAYRIIQEALTNTLRHAASADAVQVTLTFDDPDVSLCVVDNGQTSLPTSVRSFEGAHGGHGVPNMAARAAAFGGALRAGPIPSGGWGVATTLRLCRAPALT
jgi:signal transduction histidine kinase